MSIGTFCLVRNEAPWIAAHILQLLPYIDEMVFFDGNSTDGTVEIVKAIRAEHPDGGKIKLHEGRDCADLKDSYVSLFNECLHALTTGLAWFAHPDFYCVNPARLLDIKTSGAVALSTSLKSFAGEPGGELLRIKGRQAQWKNIFRLRNPDLGAHYHGHYGAWDEDVYFSAITGKEHWLYDTIDGYPYEVESSGLEVLHFSDVRTHARRLDRMKKCLANQKQVNLSPESHPRVTLKSGPDHVGNMYEFVPAEYPAEFLEARMKYSHLERSLTLVH